MALKFVDSFDGTNTAQITRKWTAVTNGVPGPLISSSAGRFGTNGLVLNDWTFDSVRVTLAAQATWIVGFAFNRAQYRSGSLCLLAFYDAGVAQCGLVLNADSTLSFYNADGVRLGTTTFALQTGVYYYIEVKAGIGSAANVTLKVNRVTRLTLVGVDTENSGNNRANEIVLGGTNGSIPCDIINTDGYFDDVYICDATGAVNNDFLGDVHIELLRPNGVGNSGDWTLFDAAVTNTENYQCVDETPPNDDSDYVETDTIGDKDTYQFEDLQIAAGTIYAVVLNHCARHTVAGSSTLTPVVRHSGTDHDGAAQTLDGSYNYLRTYYETNPGTGVAWTASDVDNAEFGQKLTA